MGLTTTPPRLRLAPPTPTASPASVVLLLAIMTLSLLGTALLGGPLLAQVPQVPRITPELLASYTDHPSEVRISVRLYLGPGAEQATYAFTQMNGPDSIETATLAVETATHPDTGELQQIHEGTRAQQLLLQRMIAIPGPHWQPLEARRLRAVRPQMRAEVTVFSPEGEILAAGELNTLDRDASSRAFLEYLRGRRCQLLSGDRSPAPLQSHVGPVQEPADS